VTSVSDEENGMLRSTLALLILTLGSTGCSSGAGAQNGNGQTPPPEYALSHSAGSAIQTTVDGSRIYGPMIMIERTGDTLQGRGPTGVVDLRKENDKTLRGFIGTGPTELHIEPLDEGGFVMRGMFSGALGRLEVRSDGIEGQLGRCQYNLRRYSTELGVAYNGRRVCGVAPLEPQTITLAPTIAAFAPIDRAAIIAILLGR
jgi:hypothetical protein